MSLEEWRVRVARLAATWNRMAAAVAACDLPAAKVAAALAVLEYEIGKNAPDGSGGIDADSASPCRAN